MGSFYPGGVRPFLCSLQLVTCIVLHSSKLPIPFCKIANIMLSLKGLFCYTVSACKFGCVFIWEMSAIVSAAQ